MAAKKRTNRDKSRTAKKSRTTPSKNKRRAKVDDDRILDALFECRTNREVADMAGCSEATVYNRLADPEFMRRYDARKARLRAIATGRLAAIFSKANTALEQAVDGSEDAVSVSAARAILDFNHKYGEVEELRRRVEELERERPDST